MHYETKACRGREDRGPRIQMRQHMSLVNGPLHLASAVIPGEGPQLLMTGRLMGPRSQS
jgi:hypothetical protein